MMKTIKNILGLTVFGMVLVFSISSCQKSFDPKSYAPTKPLPTFGGYSNSKDIEPASLVAYWPFSGSLTDSITQSTGTATGTSFTTGVKGQGLQGALNSYAICNTPPALATLTSFTISTWVNSPPPSTGIIGFFSLVNTVNFWGNLELFFENGSNNTNGKLRVHMSQNAKDYTYAVDNVPNLFNNWVNIIVSYNETTGTCTLYVNGSSVNTGTAGSLTGPLAFTSVGKVVFGTVQFMTNPSQTTGTTKQDWASYLTGSEDQIRIYNKVLTDSEASALYNLEKLGR